MVKNNQVDGSLVKKETALILVVIALIAGFFGGIIFSSLKNGSKGIQGASQGPQEAFQGQGFSATQAQRIPELEKAVSVNPNNAQAWTQLGNLYFDANSHQKAIMAYKKSLELDPNNANVWTDMGVMYRRSGQPAEAIKAFNKAIEVEPLHNISRFNKGIVLMHDLNDQEGAIKAWEELVTLNPSAKTPTGELVKDMLDKFKGTMKQKGPAG